MNKRERKRKYILQERRRLLNLKHPIEEVETSKIHGKDKIFNPVIVTAESDPTSEDYFEDVEDSLVGYSETPYSRALMKASKKTNWGGIMPDIDMRNIMM